MCNTGALYVHAYINMHTYMRFNTGCGAQYSVPLCLCPTVHIAIELEIDTTPMRVPLSVAASRSVPANVLEVGRTHMHSAFSKPGHCGSAPGVGTNDVAARRAISSTLLPPDVFWISCICVNRRVTTTPIYNTTTSIFHKQML